MSAVMEDHRTNALRVLLLVRSHPICPHCERKMVGNGSDGMTQYWLCKRCDFTYKTRDRIE